VTTKLVVPPLPRYVELIRVSSAGQAERDTPADQRRALQRLAQARPGVLVECIEDGAAGLSGAKGFADRPDLQRLAALARAREFDELRVRHVDRLTRHLDMRERAAIYGMVADAGACIVTADNHVIDPTNEIGEVDYFLQTWTSAREKKRILERTREGRRRKLAAGEIIACSPWGRTWNKTTKTWTVDERAMALYRRIFSEVLSGTTAGRLAVALNEKGEVTPRGGKWSARAICDLIHSEAAVGKLTQAGATIECPPVVDEETWRAARERLSSNASTRRGRPGSIPALLRGVATCAHCGARMYVDRGGRKGYEAVYYVCGSAARSRSTAAPECVGWHRADAVDAAMREELQSLLRDPSRLLAAVSRSDNGQQRDAEQDAAEAEKELAALSSRQEKLVRLVTRGQADDDVADRQFAEIKRLRTAAEKQLAAALASRDVGARVATDAASVKGAVESLRSLAEGAGDDVYRRLVLALFPASGQTWLRIRQDGTIDAMGGLPSPAQPQNQRNTSRATIIRCTSLVPSPISQSFASR
jgi:DNA invertase Pin-like site-specific DNA recombinase